MELDELLRLDQLASEGQITRRHLDAVASQLALSDHSTDARYVLAMLSILGDAPDFGYAPIVEPFLYSDNTTIAESAMTVLCLSWAITEPYAELILKWMMGMPSDTMGTSRVTALQVAGQHLLEHSYPAMLEDLIQIFENKNNDNVDRSTAYEALVRAMRGVAASNAVFIASRYGQLPVDSFADLGIIQSAKKRLAREEAET
jgi:hypothetical protein